MSDSQSITNDQLYKSVKNGDQKAFHKLFELYWEPMYINAKSIVMNDTIAKDIVQDIWLNLWHKRKKLNIDNLEGYIFKSVHYGCYKHLRNTKFNTTQKQAIDSLQLIEMSSVENQHSLNNTQLVVEASISALPARCQQIFRLSRFEDTSNDEIALQLGISKRSVENQVSIALKTIKQSLSIYRSGILIFLSVFFF